MGIFSGKFFEGVTFGKVLDVGTEIFGGKQTTPEPAYTSEVLGSSSYAQKQGSNTMLYMALGGVGLIMLIFMMKK